MSTEILHRAAASIRGDRSADSFTLAVADWLEMAYEQGEDDDHEVYDDAAGEGYAGECHDECPACYRFDRALAVARAHLGPDLPTEDR